jgi:hypothetical protein
MSSRGADRSVQVLIARARQHGGPVERRDSPRSTHEIPTTILLVDKDGNVTERCEGWIQDLSDFGVGMLSSTPFRISQDLILDLEAACGVPCGLIVKVHRCTQLFDGCFKVGAKALRVTDVPDRNAA